jgi:formiminotetrahydrofolate cyclodeaminase
VVSDELRGYLDALASGDTTPGGGSASAVAASIGAALVSMACAATMGREKYREREKIVVSTRDAAEGLRTLALSLSSEDAVAYTAVDVARMLPKGTAREAEVRTSRIQKALEAATEIPLKTAEVSAQVLDLCAAVMSAVNIHAASDLGVGALLARAALDGAALSVESNLTLIRDPGFRAGAAERLQHTVRTARPLFDEIMQSVRTRALS